MAISRAARVGAEGSPAAVARPASCAAPFAAPRRRGAAPARSRGAAGCYFSDTSTRSLDDVRRPRAELREGTCGPPRCRLRRSAREISLRCAGEQLVRGPPAMTDIDVQALPLTGERTVPGIPEENYWFRRHEVVYRALRARCCAGVVLEAGCGEGYGADLLAGSAPTVLAVDYDPLAVAHVARRYPHVAVARANLVALPVRD